jgi:two-component system cell cycle sensor histidine kinase/response regulator CckA
MTETTIPSVFRSFAEPHPETSPKVLVVDDDYANRQTLRAALWREELEITEAESGEAALAMVEDVEPDLILLDVMMPGIDGFQVTRALRDNPNTSEIPIILVTALDDQDTLLKGFDAGADDFLTKPIVSIELRARVRSILRLNRYRRLVEEREALEAAVEEARSLDRLYGEIIDAAQIMVQIVGPTGKILFTNVAWRSALGYSEAELPGLQMSDWIHQNDTEHCSQLMQSVFQGAEAQTLDAVFVDVNGEDVMVSGAVVGRQENGKVVTTLALLHDVTEKTKLEARLRHAHQLQQVGRLTAGVAHDFGNVLAVASLSLGAMAMEDEIPEPFEEPMHDLQESIGDGMLLVHDLMGVSRAAQIDLQWSEASSTLEAAVGTVQRLLPVSVQIRNEIAVEGWELFTHLQSLRSIFLNLASNARDAMQGRGIIHIEARPVPEKAIEIRFRDEGPGMPVDVMAQAFDPFYTTKSEEMGTGLGLVSVKGLVEQHEGSIRIESELGAGTTFVIRLPARVRPVRSGDSMA